MEWATNSVLLDRLQRFDEETAWGLLVENFRAPLERFAQRAGLAHADASDVAQDALLAFAESFQAGEYDRSRGRLKHWLFGIARKRIAAHRRQSARAPEEGAADLEQRAARDDQAVWVEEWRRAILERCLRQVESEVTPETFALFRQVVLEELPVDDVVQREGLPRTRVYNAKYRVAARLRELIERYDDA